MEKIKYLIITDKCFRCWYKKEYGIELPRDKFYGIDYQWSDKALKYLLEELDNMGSKFTNDVKQLSSGIFWVMSIFDDLSNFDLLVFTIPCDQNGTPNNTHPIELNSKNGKTYNHKKIWEDEVKKNNNYNFYSKKSYNYYPRGRVEISRNRAIIYLNPHINKPEFIEKIKNEFGLTIDNISEVRVISDGSEHYKCFLDYDNS